MKNMYWRSVGKVALYPVVPAKFVNRLDDHAYEFPKVLPRRDDAGVRRLLSGIWTDNDCTLSK